MRIIIGLGNPGSEYRGTKHNIGYDVVESIAKKYDIRIRQELYHSFVGKGKIKGEDVLLVLPQTYMNLSGKVVEELMREKHYATANLIVICDDINLKLGRIRLRKRGSSGGHKGLASIIQVMGMDDFARLRVGIAVDVHKGDITSYVLTPFKKRELKNVAHAIDLAKEAAISWVTDGIEKTMAAYNTRKVATS